MFTSVALLKLLSIPLSQLFQSIPGVMAAINCFQRIQKYLETDTKSDHRLLIQEVNEGTPYFADYAGKTHSGGEYELQKIIPSTGAFHQDLREQDAVVIRNGNFGWKSEEESVLRDINLSMKKSHLTMIIGAVASGKSTLLKTLLGETPSTQGFVYISSKEVAFCDQTPWLISGSVQKNVLGFSVFDGPWYNTVIHACGLEEDLATFPNGDQTLIGSQGITLSGGQKQRVVRAPWFHKNSLANSTDLGHRSSSLREEEHSYIRRCLFRNGCRNRGSGIRQALGFGRASSEI